MVTYRSTCARNIRGLEVIACSDTFQLLSFTINIHRLDFNHETCEHSTPQKYPYIWYPALHRLMAEVVTTCTDL